MQESKRRGINTSTFLQGTMDSAEMKEITFHLYECQICLTRMIDRNPRLLACHHSFCEECMAKLIQNKSITCPTCRQVTVVKDGEVTKLPMNFYIIQMFERESAAATSSMMPKCQLCGISGAKVKCENCIKFLCESCRDDHDDMPAFKEHKLLFVCETHGDSLAHLCKRCSTPACMACVVRNHREHKQDCVEYSEGVKGIKTYILDYTGKIEDMLETLTNNLDQIKSSANHLGPIQDDVNKWKEYFTRQIRRLEEVENIITNDKQTNVELIKTYEKSIRKAKDTKQELSRAKATDGLEIFHFVKKRKQWEDLLIALDKVLQEKYFPETVDLSNVLKRENPPELHNYSSKNWTLSLKKTIKSDKVAYLKDPDDIVCIGTDLVFIADCNLSYVPCLNSAGDLVHKYNIEEQYGEIGGVDVYGGCLYILQKEAVTKVEIADSQEKNTVAIYKPNIENMGKLLVESRSSLIISDEIFRNYKVYRYDPRTDTTSVLLEDLEMPTYISMSTPGQDVCFAVTEYYPDKVNIYDKAWALVSTVGGNGSSDGSLSYPKAVLFTPGGALVVADMKNNRVSEFILVDGAWKFKRQLLTEKDGICSPVGLAYRHPYLWVLENNNESEDIAIKCYSVE